MSHWQTLADVRAAQRQRLDWRYIIARQRTAYTFKAKRKAARKALLDRMIIVAFELHLFFSHRHHEHE